MPKAMDYNQNQHRGAYSADSSRRPSDSRRASASFGRTPAAPPQNIFRPDKGGAPRPVQKPARPAPYVRPRPSQRAAKPAAKTAPLPKTQSPRTAPIQRQIKQPPKSTAAPKPRRKGGVKSFTSRPSFKRNAVLFSIFAALLLVTVIIVAVQSCSGNAGGNFAVIQKDSAVDDTPVTTAFNGAGVLPTFAEIDDSTAALDIDSGYGILLDLKNNKVIAEKNSQEKIYPASMTKIMTMIVAYESVKSVNETFTFTPDIINPLFEEGASVAGFQAGETVTVADLIYGAALPSGADATGGIAVFCAGSEEAFADLMNEKAKALGLTKTHFVTASGLHDDNHYSTCYEMAVILEYAISIPYLRSVLGTYRYTTTKTEQHPDGITLTDTMYSRMSGDETAGIFVQGGKTGYTTEGKHCLASFAANCTEDESAYTDPQYLMVSAYATGEYTPVFDALKAYGKYCTAGSAR